MEKGRTLGVRDKRWEFPGMKVRLNFVRVCLMPPVFLAEVTNGLDPKNARL